MTLCGPGGVGKTRLALHSAAAVADDYQDGVHVIDLEPATSRTDLVAMIAAALRLTPSGDESLEDRIVSVLSIRRQLLVLDTCEHVVEAAAGVAEAIATGTDGVDILATSREPLRADGEQLLRIGPLRLGEATALLADRIRAADPSMEPMDTDPALLAEVGRRLDGLPLACELAAARVPSLGLPGVLHALDAPLTLLTRGKRTATSRLRSLRDVVRWSIDLLSEPERDVFGRLSRFAATVEYAAVAAVGPSAALLAGPATTIVARADLAWVAVEGTAVLCGPDDRFPGVDPEGIRLLLREIFTAAGGTHDDWDTDDRVMAEERRTAVLVAPRRLCVDSGNEGHALRRRVF